MSAAVKKRQPGRDNSVSVVRYNGLTDFAAPVTKRFRQSLKGCL
jgi:hypothetical protein